jgi:hypothetical protein
MLRLEPQETGDPTIPGTCYVPLRPILAGKLGTVQGRYLGRSISNHVRSLKLLSGSRTMDFSTRSGSPADRLTDHLSCQDY